MRTLKAIDRIILDFWFTAPQERFWAYLATLPVVILIIDAIAHIAL